MDFVELYILLKEARNEQAKSERKKKGVECFRIKIL
jgi:hypothetical protein